MKKTAVLCGAVVLVFACFPVVAQSFFKDLVNDIAKEVTQEVTSNRQQGNRQQPNNRTTGRSGIEVQGIPYYAITDNRWMINDYTPEMLDGYYHLRIGASGPNPYNTNFSAQGSPIACEQQLLGASIMERQFTEQEMLKECVNIVLGKVTLPYAQERVAYMRGKNKFYFRATDQALDIRWNDHLGKMVVTVTPPLIRSPWRDVAFELEGVGISDLYWDYNYNFPIAQPPRRDNGRGYMSPRYQTLLSNPRSDFPKGNVFNTVFFTITGQPRFDRNASGGQKIYTVPVSIDRIDIADRNDGWSILSGSNAPATN